MDVFAGSITLPITGNQLWYMLIFSPPAFSKLPYTKYKTADSKLLITFIDVAPPRTYSQHSKGQQRNVWKF